MGYSCSATTLPGLPRKWQLILRTRLAMAVPSPIAVSRFVLRLGVRPGHLLSVLRSIAQFVGRSIADPS